MSEAGAWVLLIIEIMFIVLKAVGVTNISEDAYWICIMILLVGMVSQKKESDKK